MVMSLGIESSVSPDMVPDRVGLLIVGFVTVIFEMFVMRLVPEIIFNNSSL